MNDQQEYVLVCRFNGQCFDDPFKWDNDTMRFAHGRIIDSFDQLMNGAVIDVRNIRDSRVVPCLSEQEFE